MRARTRAIAKMHEFFADFDVIVTPSSGTQLVATNLASQPAIIIPNGIRGDDAPKPPVNPDPDEDVEEPGGPGTPLSITFLGPLYSEARLAAFAWAYQEPTGFHKLHPKLQG